MTEPSLPEMGLKKSAHCHTVGFHFIDFINILIYFFLRNFGNMEDDNTESEPSREEATTTPSPPRPEIGFLSVKINTPRTRFPLRTKIMLPCVVNRY